MRVLHVGGRVQNCILPCNNNCTIFIGPFLGIVGKGILRIVVAILTKPCTPQETTHVLTSEKGALQYVCLEGRVKGAYLGFKHAGANT
jgi:hypothetical protein